MITSKFSEYVPITESICNELMKFTKLNKIRFHGNPVKIDPLKNSIDPNIKEKRKKELKFFLASRLRMNKK